LTNKDEYTGGRVRIIPLRVGVGVERCIILFLAGHFLFTSSYTFAAGYII